MTTFKKPSNFYIVSTPIGNLKDISLRALEILKEVDFVFCEDTRNTKKLLDFYNIKKKLISYHKYNENFREDFILKLLGEGKKIALVSDAGTPLICDPGNKLIKLLIKNDIKIEAIPGACSIVNALVLSGANLSHFSFAGWMPKKSSQKTKELLKFFTVANTVVFLESPYRIKNTLKTIWQDLQNFDDNKKFDKNFLEKIKFKTADKIDVSKINVFIAREMTKIFEEIIRGDLESIVEFLDKREKIKGEIVLIFEKT